MDTSTLENIAEDLISHKLQQQGLLVAKPKCDRLGTDLLVFSEIADGVKFCRLQSKGRSFTNSTTTNIRIHMDYVSNGFLVFLYIEYSENEQGLYVFFPNDIRQWSITPNNEYQLNISLSNSKDKLDFYKFEKTKVNLIKSLIRSAETHGEFKGLVYGRGNVVAESATASGTAAKVVIGSGSVTCASATASGSATVISPAPLTAT